MSQHDKNRSDLLSRDTPTEPKPDSKAIVQCERFRCLGFQQPDGAWVGLSGERLQVIEVVTWLKG